MKKVKTTKPFVFDSKTHQEVSSLLDTDLPVSLKYNEDLIDRIHARYPYVSKTEISVVVKGIFESLRELLVLGKILNFNKLFFDTKLHFFGYRKDGHILPSLKVKIGTPPPLRKL